MAANKDHLRRDAEHRVRLELSGLLGQYQRRIIETAYTNIGNAIGAAEAGEILDGKSIGEEAFESAASSWLSLGAQEPRETIEARSDPDSKS